MSHAENIPVTWGIGGPKIGSAKVSEDGTVEMKMDESSNFVAGEMFDSITEGFSIAPTTPPAIPEARPSVIYKGNVGVQIGNGNNQVNHFD